MRAPHIGATLSADAAGKRSWLNNIGLLKLVLRDADDVEVHVSSLLTQIVRAKPLPRARCVLLSTLACCVGGKVALP